MYRKNVRLAIAIARIPRAGLNLAEWKSFGILVPQLRYRDLSRGQKCKIKKLANCMDLPCMVK